MIVWLSALRLVHIACGASHCGAVAVAAPHVDAFTPNALRNALHCILVPHSAALRVNKPLHFNSTTKNAWQTLVCAPPWYNDVAPNEK